MPDTELSCGVAACDFVARHASENAAIALLNNHNITHTSGNSNAGAAASSRMPKASRPELKSDSTDEEWNIFLVQWKRFKNCYTFTHGQLKEQLFQCCESRLGDLFLRWIMP